MNVGGAALVVAGEERVKRGDAVVIGRLHAAESGALEDGRIVRVAHAGVALDADVDALCLSALPGIERETRITHSRVRAPDVNVGVGNRLACLVVNHLDGQRQLDALLAAGNVLPDFLSLDICGNVSILIVDQRKSRRGLHRGPWSTDGISMQAPESEKSVLRSIPLETVLLLLWSILDTEM